MKMINNWKPEVRSLIKSLTDAGCVIVHGDNGEDRFNLKPGKMAEFVNELTACDEAHLYVRTPGRETLAAVYLVFGNSPGELPADYTVRPEIEKACTEHCAKWEGRKQPQVPCPYESKRLREERAGQPGANVDTIEQLDNDIQAAAENEVNDAHLSLSERAALLARAKILMPEFEQTGNIDNDFVHLIF